MAAGGAVAQEGELEPIEGVEQTAPLAQGARTGFCGGCIL